MDNKTIFVRTPKGEEAAQSRTSPLPGDVKRALLMVDGSATFGEISKRAAPSIRASLGEMLQELEKNGFIEAKSMLANTPRVAVPPPGMVVPTKLTTPHKKPPADDTAAELDFMSGRTVPPPNAVLAQEARAEKLRAEEEEKSRQKIAAEKIRVQQEAQAILLKAEQEAAKIHEETVRRARAEAEATRLKAEQEAKKIREELEAAKLKAEREAELRLKAATREREQAEAARVQAEQQAAQMLIELEAAKLRAEEEAKASLEAAAQAHALIKAEEDAAKAREAAELITKVLSEDGQNMPAAITTTRSTSGTVLFFDVVGYTKQSVIKQIEIKRQFNHIVSGCLKTQGVGEHIILDTGDGAAIGFLQHPEDALEVAINFRKTVMAKSASGLSGYESAHWYTSWPYQYHQGYERSKQYGR